MTVRLLIMLLSTLLMISPTAWCSDEDKSQHNENHHKKENQKKKPQSTESNKGPKNDKEEIDWGYWNKKPGKDGKQYGVGIKGKLEERLNSLDESSLVDDPSGVLLDEEMENDI